MALTAATVLIGLQQDQRAALAHQQHSRVTLRWLVPHPCSAPPDHRHTCHHARAPPPPPLRLPLLHPCAVNADGPVLLRSYRLTGRQGPYTGRRQCRKGRSSAASSGRSAYVRCLAKFLPERNGQCLKYQEPPSCDQESARVDGHCWVASSSLEEGRGGAEGGTNQPIGDYSKEAGGDEAT